MNLSDAFGYIANADRAGHRPGYRDKLLEAVRAVARTLAESSPGSCVVTEDGVWNPAYLADDELESFAHVLAPQFAEQNLG